MSAYCTVLRRGGNSTKRIACRSLVHDGQVAESGESKAMSKAQSAWAFVRPSVRTFQYLMGGKRQPFILAKRPSISAAVKARTIMPRRVRLITMGHSVRGVVQ